MHEYLYNVCMHISVCMKLHTDMHTVSCMSAIIKTYMHAWTQYKFMHRYIFLARCLSNKECIIDHRCEEQVGLPSENICDYHTLNVVYRYAMYVLFQGLFA